MVRFGEERTAAISFGGRFWQHPKCVDTDAHTAMWTRNMHTEAGTHADTRTYAL